MIGSTSPSPLGNTTAETSAVALYARRTEGYEDRLQQASDILKQVWAQHAGGLVQATSLGAEDMVITDLMRRLGLPIPIATLETGVLHPQTLALIERLQAHYGVEIEVFKPESSAVVHFLAQHGERAMYESLALRKACCGLRKLEPLARLLQGRQAWITGLRREQSETRGTAAALEADGHGRLKVSPLVDWSWADVWHYISSHGVPYNPLHDAFMPSIGCAPCTRAIAVGEPFRSGRWWWEDENAKECGLHLKSA